LKSVLIWDAGFSLCILYSAPVHPVLAFTLVLWQVVLWCLKVSLPQIELMHIPTCERYSDKGETSLYVLYVTEVCQWGTHCMKPSEYCRAPLNKIPPFIQGARQLKD